MILPPMLSRTSITPTTRSPITMATMLGGFFLDRSPLLPLLGSGHGAKRTLLRRCDHPFIIELPLGKIGGHDLDGNLVAHPELPSTATPHQAIVTFYMPEIIVFQQAVDTHQPLALVLNRLHPKPKCRHPADDTFELISQKGLHVLHLLVLIGRTLALHGRALPLAGML